MVPQNKTAREEVRTEQLPAQEKLSIDPADGPLFSAEQVYAQRQTEAQSDGNLSTPAYIP